MEKRQPLFDLNTPLKRDNYSDKGEKVRIYSSQDSNEKMDKRIIVTDPGLTKDFLGKKL